MTLAITSPVFSSLGFIPPRFTRDGANISPPIEWHDAPPATRSFALIVEDPDAPRSIFRHWAVYDIPASSTSLKEGDGSREPVTLRMGRNDFGNSRYDGPQPPAGHGPHHYYFRLLALDISQLDVPAKSPATDILAAAKPRCLAEAEIIGLFETRRAPQTRQGVRKGIADADKLARTGSVDEPVRDTPPAGAWNDVAPNE
jgi:Raf kinase inhibitor-like YbhB/YbcL family protein